MLTKRSNPMIGRLSELLVSGNRVAGYLEVTPSPSPKSPLEYRIQSPKGRKSYDFGGVGLGIVAALEKSSSNTKTNGIFNSNNINNRSDPIKIVHGREINREIVEIDSLEDEEYTYVTSHGPDNKSSTKVYYNHGKSIVLDSRISGDFGVFSSIVKEETSSASTKLVDEDYYPTSEFMSSCNLCKKRLQGKDIYIYRGEKAFCSNECRSRHIMIDERKEHCKSEVQKSVDISSSSYTTSPIFSTGILAI